MHDYTTNPVKSDGPTQNQSLVCKTCNEPVTAYVDTDAVGNPTATYNCPTHGHRFRSELTLSEVTA